MDRCKRCNNELSFWGVLKSFWLNFRSIKCDICGAVQQHAERNRLLGGLVIFLAFLFTSRLLFSVHFDAPTFLAYIGVTAITAILFSLIAVQFMRFNILQAQRFQDKNRK